MPTAISKKSWAGVGKEAVPYTAQTSPTVYVPGKSTMKFNKKREYIDDERNSRDDNYDVVDTTRQGAFDIKGNWYNDTSGYFVLGALGADTVTQPDATHAPTVYQHAMALADSPPTLTLFRGLDWQVYYMAGCGVEKIVWKFSAEGKLLEFDAQVMGIYPVPYGGGPLTPVFSAVKPFPGYAPTLTLGGVTSSIIDEMTITFEQKIKPFFPAAGSQDLTSLDYGGRKVTVDFQARFDSGDTLFTNFQNGVDASLIVDFKGALIANSGGTGVPPNTNYNEELKITIPVLSYDTGEHETGKENIMAKYKGTARPSASPLISAMIQNTVATYN
jgi:hypothetical protein